MSQCSFPASPSPLASACLLLLLNFTSLCKQSAMRGICSVHKFPAFFVQLWGLIIRHFQLGNPGCERLQPQRSDASEAEMLLHSYPRTRTDHRDAAGDLRVSEPQGSPALSPRNKDTQSTASLKPCFKTSSSYKSTAQPSLCSPVCPPTPKETLPLVMLCRLAASETQPA